MPRTGRPKAVLELTEAERDQLLRWEHGGDCTPALALRSRIVLRCDTGLSNRQVAEAVGVSAATAGKWRARFCELRLDGLSDARRPGRPAAHPAEQVEADDFFKGLSAQDDRMSVAMRRLIDAVSELPAELALIEPLINRGLDDHALAAMTGMSADAITARRRRIVEHLSDELGLPQDEIREAMAERARSAAPTVEPAGPPVDERPAALTPESGDESDQPRNGDDPHAVDPPAEAAMPTTVAEPAVAEPVAAGDEHPAALTPESGDEASRPGRRRHLGLWAAISAVLVLVLVQLVALLHSGSGGQPQASTRASVTTTTASTPPSATSPRPPTVTSHPASQALRALPGGLAHARGSVVLAGGELTLTVEGLPAIKRGHYGVWLYNSVLDSQSLGRLPAGEDHLTVRLPSDAHRYRWIDISFQPRGFVNHSGESVLRAINPAR